MVYLHYSLNLYYILDLFQMEHHQGLKKDKTIQI